MGTVISIIFDSFYGSKNRSIMKRSVSEVPNANIPGNKALKFGETSSRSLSLNLNPVENGNACIGDTISGDKNVTEYPETTSPQGISEQDMKLDILREHIERKETNYPFSKLNGVTNCKIAKEVPEIIDELHINNLPTSVLLHILQYLSMNELIKKAALVCKRWNELCLDPDLWRNISFKGQLKVSDEVLERYTNFKGRVTQSLDLTDLRLITSEGVRYTLGHCYNLKKLHLIR